MNAAAVWLRFLIGQINPAPMTRQSECNFIPFRFYFACSVLPFSLPGIYVSPNWLFCWLKPLSWYSGRLWFPRECNRWSFLLILLLRLKKMPPYSMIIMTHWKELWFLLISVGLNRNISLIAMYYQFKWIISYSIPTLNYTLCIYTKRNMVLLLYKN